MKRYYIQFIGRVQGVGFRYTLYELANKYKMTGYCRNMSNGNVEVEIQGENFYGFLKELFEPRHFISIEDYVLKEIPVDLYESKFTVEY